MESKSVETSGSQDMFDARDSCDVARDDVFDCVFLASENSSLSSLFSLLLCFWRLLVLVMPSPCSTSDTADTKSSSSNCGSPEN